MVVKPYTWVSWSDARSRMPEICSGWSWDSEHADKAMVSSLRGDPLRSRNVPVRGVAQVADADLMAMRLVPLKDVAADLLSTNGRSAEYEVTRLSAGLRVGGMLLPPRHVTDRKNAMLSGAQLAWEAFRDDLIRYELPDGAKPSPDPADVPEEQESQRVPRVGARGSSSTRKQRLAYKRRIAEFKKLGRLPPIETTKAGEQGDREWAVANGVSRPKMEVWRREMLPEKPSRGRPRNSAS